MIVPMTDEERQEAFARFQNIRHKARLYNAIRRKAIRRTLNILRKKYHSEYEALLNRETEELTKQYRAKEEHYGKMPLL